MNNSNITSTERDLLLMQLANHLSVKGRTIMGSKLGSFIAIAVSPRPFRTLGKLRDFAKQELHDMVIEIPQTNEKITDLCFQIRNLSKDEVFPIPTANVESFISHEELWRLFSNPTIKLEVGIKLDGQAVMAANAACFELETRSISRLDKEVYRELANEFLSVLHIDESLKNELNGIIQQPEFYSTWIKKLRETRTESFDLLRRWEEARADLVASRLKTSLIEKGIESKVIDEVLKNARPVPKSNSSQTAAHPLKRAAAFVDRNNKSSQGYGVYSFNDTNLSDVNWLRRVWHDAIDQMSLNDLRDLKINSGIMMDCLRHNSK